MTPERTDDRLSAAEAGSPCIVQHVRSVPCGSRVSVSRRICSRAQSFRWIWLHWAHCKHRRGDCVCGVTRDTVTVYPADATDTARAGDRPSSATDAVHGFPQCAGLQSRVDRGGGEGDAERAHCHRMVETIPPLICEITNDGTEESKGAYMAACSADRVVFVMLVTLAVLFLQETPAPVPPTKRQRVRRTPPAEEKKTSSPPPQPLQWGSLLKRIKWETVANMLHWKSEMSQLDNLLDTIAVNNNNDGIPERLPVGRCFQRKPRRAAPARRTIGDPVVTPGCCRRSARDR